MEYEGNEYELELIRSATIKGIDQWYIFCTNHPHYYLLTDGTLPEYDAKLHKDKVYYPSEATAKQFYENWKKTKEVGAVKEEKKVVVKKEIKRMNQTDFVKALNEI